MAVSIVNINEFNIRRETHISNINDYDKLNKFFNLVIDSPSNKEDSYREIYLDPKNQRLAAYDAELQLWCLAEEYFDVVLIQNQHKISFMGYVWGEKTPIPKLSRGHSPATAYEGYKIVIK